MFYCSSSNSASASTCVCVCVCVFDSFIPSEVDQVKDIGCCWVQSVDAHHTVVWWQKKLSLYATDSTGNANSNRHCGGHYQATNCSNVVSWLKTKTESNPRTPQQTDH